MGGLQQLHAQRKTTSSVPPSPPKPRQDPMLERMIRLPERKRVSGVWTPDNSTGTPELMRTLFSLRETFAATDILLTTASVACRRQGMETVLERSFRSLGEDARQHLHQARSALVSSAMGLVAADHGKVGMLRDALAEAVRLCHYAETDIIVSGRDSRFSPADTGPLAEAMFLAASKILVEERGNRSITDDAFLTIDGVTSWMGSGTCRMLLGAIAAVSSKRVLLSVMQEARTYTGNENGLRRALLSIGLAGREAGGQR